MATLADQVRALLVSRGIDLQTVDPRTDVVILHGADGLAIARWDAGRLGPQPTAAELAAVTDADVAQALAVQQRREAQAIVDSLPRVEKAILLTMLDQINLLRQRAGLATVTPQQAIAAVRAKAGEL